MTSPPHLDRPPRAAAWFISLFIFSERSEAIMGDLLEEFSQLSSQSGVVSAGRWYWRQVVPTIAHLVWSAYRMAPWSTTAAVAGGFLLRRLTARLVEPAIFSIVDRYQLYESHFAIYKFLASSGIDLGHLITFVFVGCIVALLANRREMASTMGLGMILAAMAVVGSLAGAARMGNDVYLWRMGWYLADSCAIVIGGVFVRAGRAVPGA